MFDSIIQFFKKMTKKEEQTLKSKDAAKERLHLVLMQDRANVSADFLDLMRQEIIEVIKKYIDIDENSMDVRLTNKENTDGTNGAPALYANIPILNIKDEARKNAKVEESKNDKKDSEKNKKENEKEEKSIKEEEKNNNNEEKNEKENEKGKNSENKENKNQ